MCMEALQLGVRSRGRASVWAAWDTYIAILKVSEETFSEKNKKLLPSNPEEDLSPRRHIRPKTNLEY